MSRSNTPLTLSLLLTLALLSPGAAQAQEVEAGHCVLTLGRIDYSPALTLLPKNTTMTVRGVGTGCVGVNVASGEEVLETSWVEIVGSLTGNAGTLLSSYYGTITTTYHFADGTSQSSVVEGTCLLGISGICPILGVVTSGVDQGTLAEFTFIAPSIDILGPIPTLNFLDVATTRARLSQIR
ncbi:hypothetical protein SAMN05443572_101514 [Myxococcus fulvus]|uniref:Lipoprotein n=1 Tax=Myxococcus fulvus TaxID=33 RepID=A0A511T0R8_MYXFU|nr:hypothetical protein [Myxococcus fulvus]AKF84723.1 hypothetical protein MFUL124B02_03495 [Myxococcus fulvus 124B02]GEN07467.1 hypothetical protein MFU01_25040 [Myxococcus fulvus]SES89929.1 hypothetical protein SAMN05443572_101514 [Myxococcus fulvus]